MTDTGTRLESEVPLPSWPAVPDPQHFAVLEDVRAHVCTFPADTAMAPDVRSDTLVGASFSSVDPLPSWPYGLNPQHLAAPVEVIAHVSPLPADTAVTPEVNSDTQVGIAALSVDPLPS